MNENTYNNSLSKIAIKLANAEVQLTQYEALYEEAQKQTSEMSEVLQKINEVMEANPELKELFDEAEKGM